MPPSADHCPNAKVLSEEDHSIPKIFIRYRALLFQIPFDVHPSERSSYIGDTRLLLQGFQCPTIDPFHHHPSRHGGAKIFRHASVPYGIRCFKAVEIQVKDGSLFGAIFVYQGKSGRSDTVLNLPSLGEAFDQLGFSSSQVAGKTDNPALFHFAGPLDAECMGFFRTIGSDRNHASAEDECRFDL